MKRLIRLISVAIFLFFLNTTVLRAETIEFDKLGEKTYEALQLTEMKEYERAKTYLQDIEQILKKFKSEKKIEKEKIRIVLQTCIDAILGLEEEVKHNEAINRIKSLQLALDSIKLEENPVWKSLEEPVMSKMLAIETSMINQDHDSYLEQLDQLLEQYNVLRPALQLYVSGEKWDSLDKTLQSFSESRNYVFFKADEGEKEFQKLRTQFENIFQEVNKDEEEPSLFLIICITGTVIISSLSYVAWRKYVAKT